MCGSNPGVIQPIKTTNCLLLNQVLVNGYQDCGQIAAKKLSWHVFALVVLTHSYLLKGEEEPQCIPCNAPLTINHILIDCVDLAPTRQSFFHVDSLTTLFDTVKFESLFDFLKEIRLYKRYNFRFF